MVAINCRHQIKKEGLRLEDGLSECVNSHIFLQPERFLFYLPACDSSSPHLPPPVPSSFLSLCYRHTHIHIYILIKHYFSLILFLFNFKVRFGTFFHFTPL